MPIAGSACRCSYIASTCAAIDPVAANNTSRADVVAAAGTNAADLSIQKTTTTPSVLQNEAVQYQIVVSNAGPDAVTGAQISDSVPSSVDNVRWTCTATGGASCGGTASGSGNTIALSADLPDGGSVIDQRGQCVGNAARHEDDRCHEHQAHQQLPALRPRADVGLHEHVKHRADEAAP